MNKKKLLILDYSFQNYRGHHFNYNYELFKKYKNIFDIKIYVNQKIKKKIKKKFNNKLIPIFLNNNLKEKKLVYQIKKLVVKFLKKKLTNFFLKKIFAKKILFNYLSSKFQRIEIKSPIIHKYIDIILQQSEATILVHTLSTNEFIEFCLAANEIKDFKKNKIILVYRRDPRELKNCFFLVKKLFIRSNFYLFTDSIKIKNFLIRRNIKSYLLKIPIFSIKKKQSFKKKKKLMVSYFGDARYEKGFFDLPELININSNSKFNFLIQSNDNGYDLEKIKKSKEILQKNNNVHFLEKEQTNLEYENNFKKTDIVILPYLKNFYKYRTSAIFIECLYHELPSIIRDKTWMSSFYEKNYVLKNLILKKNNDINLILNFIYYNYQSIIKEIVKVKKKFLKINNFKNFDIILNKKIFTSIYAKKNLNFIVDDNTFIRKKDGNATGTSNIINNLLKDVFSNHNLNCNALCNLNVDPKLKSKFIDNIFKNIKLKIHEIDFKFFSGRSFFELKKGNLTFHQYFDHMKIRLNDINIINYHYFTELIDYAGKIKTSKTIIIVHDHFNKINNNINNFKDIDNLYYIFVSLKEFNNVKFINAQKYLIYPNSIKINKNNYLLEKKQNYQFYYISSGSNIDLENLEIFLKKNNIKLNLVGEICNKINKGLSKYKNLVIHGHIENLNDLYENNQNIFLILRYVGTGIPIKLLEAISFKSKVILIGDKERFGLPYNYFKNIFFKNINSTDKINLINYKYLYNKLIKYINKNNKYFINKLKKDLHVSI